jgi:hypothetical protein
MIGMLIDGAQMLARARDKGGYVKEHKPRQHYLSYLLRLWQASEGDTQVWRASLDSPGTRERQGFASLEDLFDFLQAQTGSQSEPDQWLRDAGEGTGGQDD